jgi:peptidoglycan biosynthesis protein MviN/MurJ (putative lipid II flippase)
VGVAILAFFQNRLVVQTLGAGALVDSYYLIMTVPMALISVFSVAATNLVTPAYSPKAVDEPLDGVPRLLVAAALIVAIPLVLQVPLSALSGLWDSPDGGGVAWKIAGLLCGGAAAYGVSFSLQPLLVARGKTAVFVLAQVANASTFIALLVLGFGRTLESLATVFLIAALVQAAWALAGLVRTIRLEWSFAAPIPVRVRERVKRGTVPVLLAVAFLQGSLVVDRFFADAAGVGVVTTYYIADRMIQMLVSVVAMALGLAVFAEFSSERDERSTRILGKAIEAVIALFAPAAAVLWLCGPDIVRVLFGGGRFDAAAVDQSGLFLRILALALVPLALIVVMPRRVQAAERYGVHAWIALGILLTNLAAKVVLIPVIGVAGLAVGVVIAYTLAGSVYVAVLSRLGMLSIGDGFLRRIGVPVALAAATVALGAIVAPEGAAWWLAPIVALALFGMAAAGNDGIERQMLRSVRGVRP